MGQYKKDITPVLMHWSYVFLAPTHRYIFRFNTTNKNDLVHCFYDCTLLHNWYLNISSFPIELAFIYVATAFVCDIFVINVYTLLKIQTRERPHEWVIFFFGLIMRVYSIWTSYKNTVCRPLPRVIHSKDNVNTIFNLDGSCLSN